ncbi:MAG: dihydrofolate reductase family protein [Ferruginibacter sp.]
MMQKTVVEITMSLDGFVAGTGISKKHPLGEGGERLHHWIFDGKTDADAVIINEFFQSNGAVIVGSRTYDTGIEEGWGGVSPFPFPAFVICSKVPEKEVAGFIYVTGGINTALNLASVAADEKNVLVMGGANIIQQYLKAKLVDGILIHIAPVLFSAGTRLFDLIGERIELKKIKVIDTPAATHIYYDVVK